MQAPTSLESLPAEILLEIIGWVVGDNIELDILAVSKDMRSIALSHPILQALGAFRIEQTKTGVKVGANTDAVETQAATVLTARSLCPPNFKPVRDLVTRKWCNKSNMRQLQLALARKLIQREWTPFLKRDGRLDQPGTRTHLLNRATEMLLHIEHSEISREESDWHTLADTVDGYSWTCLQIWPARGLVVIRDRVSNSSREIMAPVVKLIEDVKNLPSA